MTKTTDQLDEMWDLYDRDMHVVGQVRRRDAIPGGTYHLAVGVIVFDGAGNVLVQQRSHLKLTHPDQWELGAGGSALQGEDGVTAVQRELLEEMQLHAEVTDANRLSRKVYATWIEEWFAVQLDFTLADVQIQTAEVAQVKLLPVEEARALMAVDGIQSFADELGLAGNWLRK